MEEQNPLSWIKEDHSKMRALLQALKDTDSSRIQERELLGSELMRLVRLHFDLNDQIVYPSLKEFVGSDDPVLDYALGLQEETRGLIRQMKTLSPSEPEWEDLLGELEEAVTQHIHDEETEICTRLEKADYDLSRLNRDLRNKRSQLDLEWWQETA